MKKKFLIALLGVLLFGLGFGGAMVYRSYRNSKSVVLRFSDTADKLDYDLVAATNYLTYQFEKNGYDVLKPRFSGDFYNNDADNVKINVFVRNSRHFFDTRLKDDAVNLYYLHRFYSLYLEELRGYTNYLSSQKNFLRAIKYPPNAGFLGGGAIPHEILVPNYEYDVLYIYEWPNDVYIEFLQAHCTSKIYSGHSFGQLSEKERQVALAKAKLVIYEMENPNLDDDDYVPYAVYDIMSYGRPILTNYKRTLDIIFKSDIYLFNDTQSMINFTQNALAQTTSTLERRAASARQKLFIGKDEDFSQFLKNINH